MLLFERYHFGSGFGGEVARPACGGGGSSGRRFKGRDCLGKFFERGFGFAQSVCRGGDGGFGRFDRGWLFLELPAMRPACRMRCSDSSGIGRPSYSRRSRFLMIAS